MSTCWWHYGKSHWISQVIIKANFTANCSLVVEIFQSDWRTLPSLELWCYIGRKKKQDSCPLSESQPLPSSSYQTVVYNSPLHPTLLPAATHLKVRLNNMHFSALQKHTEALFFSLCSAVKGSSCRWCHMTWQQRQHSTHTRTITHLLKFHFVKFIDVADEVRSPLRDKSCDGQSAHQLLI